MISTIKLTNQTKDRLIALDIAEKNKTYDVLVNELISYYENSQKRYKRDYKDWKNQLNVAQKQRDWYNKYQKEYEQEKKQWNKLLKWAKSQGFKG